MANEIDLICAELGLAPSPTQASALADYLDLLGRWNARYNLTAARDRESMLTHHLADSLAVVPSLKRHAGQGRLLDVGSGGGLPGAIVATMLPDWDVTCVDAVAKKAAFVRQVSVALMLPNLHSVHGRIEDTRSLPFDVVTCRAFAALVDFTALTSRHVASGGAWMAMKGRTPNEEIAALPATIDVFHVEPLRVPGLGAERCLVWMRKRSLA